MNTLNTMKGYEVSVNEEKIMMELQQRPRQQT